MQSLSGQQSRHGDGDANSAKKTPLSFSSLYSQLPQLEYHDSQGDLISCPNTPSMTRGSSTSTSSSVVYCHTCNNSSSQCQCQGQTETGGLYLHISEGEGTRGIRTETTEAGYHSANSKFLSPQRVEVHTPLDLSHEQSDFEGSEDGDDDSEDDEHDEDDEWSGQNNHFEAIVLAALGGDLELAAYLIPVLHRSYYSDIRTNVKQKVGPWRQGITKCSPGVDGTGNSQTPSSTAQTTDGTNKSRKRQRRRGSSAKNREVDEEDENDDDEDENRDSKEFGEPSDNGVPRPFVRFACPFHKKDATKYCTQLGNTENSKNDDYYRSCGGPGFRSIQRLKEHIKRKHYPVQCDRCYKIFVITATDRTTAVRTRERHRQLPEPCERRDPSLKEGISEAQCTELDKKKSNKRNQSSSEVEKYWEIWDILFPDCPRPASPWYDGSFPVNPIPVSHESLRFSELFNRTLELQVNQQHIRFPPGLESEMREKLEILAQKVFSVFVTLHGVPSSTSSSSTISTQQTSLLNGSYQLLSTPPARNRWTTSTPSRLSDPRSQAFSADLQSSPSVNSVNPMMVNSPRRSNIQAGFLETAGMHIPQPTFSQDRMNGVQSQQLTRPEYVPGMHNNMQFSSNTFNDTSLDTDSEFLYGMGFPDPADDFHTPNLAAVYVNPSTQDLPAWKHDHRSRHQQFDRS